MTQTELFQWNTEKQNPDRGGLKSECEVTNEGLECRQLSRRFSQTGTKELGWQEDEGQK